jgi:hypothetical protein
VKKFQYLPTLLVPIIAITCFVIFTSHARTNPSPAPTPTPTPQPISTLPLATSWKKYSHKFQNLKFAFQYPSDLTIDDSGTDVSSININHGNVTVFSLESITSSDNPEYPGGPPTDWFNHIVAKANPQANPPPTVFYQPVTASTGSIFYLIVGLQLPNGTLPWPLSPNTDTYLTISNSKAILLHDYHALPSSDVLRILSSLNVN